MDGTGMAGGQLTYLPPPNELPYYDALFVTADHTNSGQLGGREAVNFLSRSKLPLDLLKNIWGMADKPQTNTLDKNKFFVAVRLIQLFQNGEKAKDSALNCANPAIRPPFFEGVTGVSIQPFHPAVPAQQPPATAAPAMAMEQYPTSAPLSPARAPVDTNSAPQVTSTLAVQDPYTMPPGEQSRYETLFPQYCKEDGFVYGKEAVELFSKSGLDKGTLRDIWNMVDDPIDNKLSKLEFAMAMHLIVCISKKGLQVPPSLPMSLKALKEPGKKPVMGGGPTASGPPPLPTQTSQQQSQQQFISQTASHDASYIGAVPSGGDSVVGGGSIMGGGASILSGGMSITDAFGDLNPEEVAKAGGSYYLGKDTTSPTMQPQTQVLQPPPVPSTNLAPVAPVQPEQSTNHAFYQHEPFGSIQPAAESSFNMNPTAMSAAPAMSTMSAPVVEKSIAPTPAPTIPTPNVGASSSFTTGNNDAEELEKMKSILQKLQAENISLKAQMGQYTAEELQVRSDITKTIEEIGKITQEVASLRVQVSDAKAALIEATAELKFAEEKKQDAQSLVNDLGMARDTLNTAMENVNEIKTSIDFNQTNTVSAPVSAPTPVVVPAQNEVTNFFEFQPPAPNPTPVANSNFDLMGGTVGTFPNNAPMSDSVGLANNQGSILSNDDLSYQSLQQVMSNRTIEEVDELKEQAKKAENAAQTADDHARALSMQLDNIQVAVEEAEKAAEEKQNATKAKKKGFGRGGKKSSKKDVEAAVKDVTEKKKQFEDTKSERSAAEAEAIVLKDKASKLREQAEQAEIELAQAASMMNSNTAAPVPAKSYDFSYMSTASLESATTGSLVNAGNGHSNPDLVAANYGGINTGGVETTLKAQPSHATAQPNHAVSNQNTDYANPFGF